MLQIYCGDGKGKTTAAIGQLVRMAGRGKTCVFFQFMKDGTSGEGQILKALDQVTVVKGKDKVKFTFRMTEEEKKADAAFYEKTLLELSEMKADLFVLDEAINAVRTGLLSEEALWDFLDKKTQAEVVLTGRGNIERLFARADYITEMKKVKHPFDRGLPARSGIEY